MILAHYDQWKRLFEHLEKNTLLPRLHVIMTTETQALFT